MGAQHPGQATAQLLLPGEPSDDLRCEVFHADVSATPQYEALSYTWGSQRLTSCISINNKEFRVTENCRCALHDLRERTATRILWIDAICINQTDNEEKNDQIPLITRIYSQAQRALVYLGNERREKITQLFDYLRRRDASGNKAPHPTELTEEQRIQLQGELSWMLSLPWFTRVWVLQEVAVSRQSLVFLGGETLDWRLLSFGNIYSLDLNPVDKDGGFPRALQLSSDDREPIKDLVSLLTVARSCLSTDPRDKIYALLGIFKNNERIHISMDYNKPVQELYAEISWHVINTYGHLELLSDAEAGNSPRRWKGLPNDALPTWIPDYSQHPRLRSLASWRPKQAGDEAVAHVCTPPGTDCLALKVSILETDTVAAHIPTGCDAGFWGAFAPQLERSGHGANIDTLQSFATYRSLVSTKESFAITPTEVRAGDVVCLIRGASVPFVLSPVHETQSTYKLAGECYLHGTKGPKHVDDYMELLGVYGTNFDCTHQRDLPWKEAYLV
ncbi:hypothetical protein SLS54_009732 [Diplodia seriata]